MKKKICSTMNAALFVTIIIILFPGGAAAQTGFGLRAGAGARPDQFHFGAHFVSDSLVNQLVFRPNLEIGVGSGVTTFAANFEFAYRFPLPKSRLSAYVGAGPALNVYRLGRNVPGSTQTGGGFNVLFGLEHRDGLFGEFKVGAIDSPEFKFTVGYTFP
jgi:hypothetical protein